MKKSNSGPSLVAQWLRLGASTAGSVPRWDLLRGMAEKKKVTLRSNVKDKVMWERKKGKIFM